MSELKPKDHGEAVALFRSEIIGALTKQDLDHGDLRAELAQLSARHCRAPGSKVGRRYALSTLERWLYRYKKGGLEALRPAARSDRGRARELTVDQRELLLDIRREHRAASVPLILRTLVLEGRPEKGAVSAATLRRLYVDNGLDRIAARDGAGPKTRLRWQAEHPGALWHSDVCHGPSLLIGKEHKPVRIHAILDDASRYIVALEAQHTERELDMLRLMVRALRQHGAPDALYLDNGSTYRGDTLRVACGRPGISLLHAKPYDPEARGKMSAFGVHCASNVSVFSAETRRCTTSTYASGRGSASTTMWHHMRASLAHARVPPGPVSRSARLTRSTNNAFAMH